MICSQCHGMVHATYTNKTLAVVYATSEELGAQPELAPFIKWVRKQPITRKKRNKERASAIVIYGFLSGGRKPRALHWFLERGRKPCALVFCAFATALCCKAHGAYAPRSGKSSVRSTTTPLPAPHLRARVHENGATSFQSARCSWMCPKTCNRGLTSSTRCKSVKLPARVWRGWSSRRMRVRRAVRDEVRPHGAESFAHFGQRVARPGSMKAQSKYK